MTIKRRLQRLEADADDARVMNAPSDTLTDAELNRAIELHARRLNLSDEDLVRLYAPSDGGLS